MSGSIIRYGITHPYCCQLRPPSHSVPLRTVWRCNCGRRWITYMYDRDAPGFTGITWRRKWLPTWRKQ